MRTIWFFLLIIAFIGPASMVQAQSSEPEVVPGELIVKLKGKGNSSRAAEFLSKAKSKKKLKLKNSFARMNLHHFELEVGEDLKSKIAELKNDPDVEYAEPNYVLRKVQDEAQPGQMLALSQEEMVNAQSVATGSYQQSGANVQATEAWPLSNAGSERPIVAVIDTGVDITHSVFNNSDAIWTNGNEIAGNSIDDDNNGYVDDVHGWNFFVNSKNMYDDDGHGTHVAGIILGVSQDIFDAANTAPSKVRIMPLKFLGADGSGSTTSAIKAIYYAVNNGAQVINNSWGGSAFSASLQEAMSFAYENGVVLVSAAGNSARNNDVESMYPANYDTPSNISVAASNDWDALASFSNFGATKVHVAAPGVSIVSTIPNEQFAYSSGTSMAAPFIAGLAAFIWRESPNLTGFQIKSIILESVDSKSGLQNKVVNAGRANVLKAIQDTLSLSGADPYQPVYSASSSASRDPASQSSMGGGGGCGVVRSLTQGGGPGANGNLGLIVSCLFLVPFIFYQAFRRKDGAQRRRYDRFKMNSEITVKIGDRELVGAMSSISLGGVSFNADALLEKGGIITMQIKSPDGKEAVEVEGRVVWNEKNQNYGVQFADARETALQVISRWTGGLSKI